MTATSTATHDTPIDPATNVGLLALSVADLARSVDYYTGPIGLALLAQDETSATLGVAGQPLLLLSERQGAAPWPRGGRSYTGLYHFAILLPTQAALGAWLRHWRELGLPAITASARRCTSRTRTATVSRSTATARATSGPGAAARCRWGATRSICVAC